MNIAVIGSGASAFGVLMRLKEELKGKNINITVISKDLNFINTIFSKNTNNKKTKSIKSPGQLRLHYYPGIPVFMNRTRAKKNEAFITFGNKYKNAKNYFNLSKNSKEIKKFANQTNLKIRDNLYNSYDFLLNEKYKVKINQKTLDRMKNYFK